MLELLDELKSVEEDALEARSHIEARIFSLPLRAEQLMQLSMADCFTKLQPMRQQQLSERWRSHDLGALADAWDLVTNTEPSQESFTALLRDIEVLQNRQPSLLHRRLLDQGVAHPLMRWIAGHPSQDKEWALERGDTQRLGRIPWVRERLLHLSLIHI